MVPTMRWLVPTVLAVFVACADPSSPESASHPRDLVPSQDRLRSHITALAADTMCGRAAGTPYERSAGNYLRDRFVEYGLVPAAGEDFFQEFLLDQVGPALAVANATTSAVLVCDSTYVGVSRNVLGALPGEGSLATQWVVLGAHYDHVGWRLFGDSALIFNGADDNASGTALMLEIARLLSRFVNSHPTLSPRRSVLFSGYGAEEAGLVGSRFFTANPTIPLDSVVAMVNLDMVGRLRENQLIISGGYSAAQWPDLLEVLVPPNLGLVYDPSFSDRSDLFGFLQHGIPAVHFFTGLHDDYHAPTDDASEVNFDGMELVGRLAIPLLWELATDAAPLGGS